MPNTVANTTITIDLPRALKADLNAHKARTGAPQAFIVRQAIAQYLDRQKQQVSAIDCAAEV